LIVPRVRYLAFVVGMSFPIVGCQNISVHSTAGADVLAPAECRARDEYGFGCHAEYLASAEQQIRSILEEIAAYNAVHHTSFEPKRSQAAWEAARQARCGIAPSRNQDEPDASFDRVECYMDVTDERALELDTVLYELPP
jgi:uncharacterized protein YecT (DUF1311 family)